MRVEQLIAELQKCNQNSTVVVNSRDGSAPFDISEIEQRHVKHDDWGGGVVIIHPNY